MKKNLDKAVIYNVYPTSFYDSDGDGIGDLKGITEKLPYLAELADIVWINPIFVSPFHDGGYDIAGRLDQVLEEFDHVIGLSRLKAVHLNDSLNPLGSHKDRHANIGKGTLGLEAFERMINHPVLRDLPFYLETPNDDDGHGEEIALLKSLYHGS